jgi:sugar phosphate isomerase/epimerase
MCGRWPLGWMVAAGFETRSLESQLARLAGTRFGHVEVYPRWAGNPDPEPTRRVCQRAGVIIHSVHGVWGSESHSGERIDLASLRADLRRRSVEEVGRSVAYAGAVGAACVVVHPGVLSDPETLADRADALRAGLEELLPLAERADVRLCLENMPPGVHPGSRTGDLFDLIESIGDSRLGICLDTGHAHIVDTVAGEIRAAGRWLVTTHVHGNDGRTDQHAGPLEGAIPWDEAKQALAEVDYSGPLMLECSRWYNRKPSRMNAEHLDALYRIGELP